ncbi:PKD domain-containing protein [Pedobacter sp. JCM 36344]|uniref:PKD domain-containing protein n=1 Tax=Pedobacter sp. JCM 36344 TaxID=3374280 RepID=UPI00397C9205
MNKIFKPFLLLVFAAMIVSCEKDRVLPEEPLQSEKLPLVDYAILPGDDPFTFKFENKSSGFEKVEWRFGDDTLSTVLSPTHVFLAPGLYQVDLQAFNSENAVSRKLVDIKIVPDSVVKVTATKTGVLNQVKFNLSSKAKIVSAKWTFNDVSPSVVLESMNPVRDYQAGSFNSFSVTITTDKGSMVTFDKFVTPEGIADNITQNALSFVASIDNSNTNENAAKLIDNDLDTKALLAEAPLPLTFKFQFYSAQTVKIYAIGSANDSDSRDPKTWTLEGSNDDLSWTILDSRSLTSTFYTQANSQWKQLFYFTIAEPKPFVFYRWKITSIYNDVNFQASEIRLFR